MKKYFLIACCILGLFACKKEEVPANEPMLIVKLKVDSTQVRLGNTGLPAPMPTGHAGQNPRFNKIAAHYMELDPTAYTPLGGGVVLYHADETTTGGATAIDFSKSKVVNSGDIFLQIPLKQIAHGSYEWVRLSLSYQNYDVTFYYNNNPYTGTVASFVGYNTYITNYVVKSQTDTVNENKLQGYWAFESLGNLTSGQAPAGATTVPNPIFATSPIPQGSCVVTGQFSSPLVIDGTETKDIVATMSLSINNSFEWIDTNGNGHWDASLGGVESVVDMGLRGLMPSYQR